MPGAPADRLHVLTEGAWAPEVAARLADRLTADPRQVICLPAGATPLPVYDLVPDALAVRGAAATATVVLLDEYLGLLAGHPARCDAVLRRRLLDRLDPSPTLIPFDVDGPDAETAARAHRDAVERVGGLDLVVLGLGRNGHLGMNEPGSGPAARTRRVQLATSSREAAIAYGADPPPTHGVTLGVAEILAAPEVWLLVTGADKATILAAALEGPVTPDVPASYLQPHPGLVVYADTPAAAALRGRG